MPLAARRLLPFLICIGFLALGFHLCLTATNAQTPPPPSREVLQAWRDATFLNRIPLAAPVVITSTARSTNLKPELQPGQGVVWQMGSGNDWNIQAYYNSGGGHGEPIIDYDPAPQLRPVFRPGSDQIAYVFAYSNTDADIVKADLRGNPRINLTNSPGIDDYPSWSPDGRHIYFASTRDGNWEIYRMDADGANQTRITYDPAPNLYPTLTPDGNTLAWISYASNTTGAIFLQELTTGNVQQLTPILQYPSDLVWSADSSALYFSYEGNDDLWFDVGKVNRDGSNLHRFRGAPFWNDLIPTARYLGDDDLLIERYSYGVANNQLVLNDITIDRLRVPESEMEPWMDDLNTYILAADFQKVDTQAPVVQMRAIPGTSEWVHIRPSLTVAWTASDSSIFTTFSFDIQQRLDNGEWTTLHEGIGETFIAVQPPTGQLAQFRVRGRDSIGNLGEWSAPTRAVRTYKYGLDAQLTDNRGVPMLNASLDGTPVVDFTMLSEGRYRAYLQYLGSQTLHEVQIQADGYGTFPPYRAPLQNQQTELLTLNGYLRGTNELLTNGDFENNFSGWRTWLTTMAAPEPHTGQRAAYLRPTTAGGTARLYRPVIIPEGMYNPTFSFAYGKLFSTRPPLQVLVDNGVTQTVAFQDAGTTDGDYEIGWVDMSPWAGETVTVTFSVAPGVAPNSENPVTIDNVSLSSWATPLVTDLTPTQIPTPSAGTVITMTGENLIAPLMITIGEHEIEATVVNSDLATFPLPADLPPGWYAVEVRNGMGISRVASQRLQVGRSVLLPSIYRN